MLSQDKKRKINDLAGKVVEEIISDTEFAELEALIVTGPDAAGWYQKSIRLHFELQEMGIVPVRVKETPLPAGVLNSREQVVQFRQPRKPRPQRPAPQPKSRPVFWPGIAALLVIGIGIYWMQDRFQPAPEVVEAPKSQQEALVPAPPVPEPGSDPVKGTESPPTIVKNNPPSEPAPKSRARKKSRATIAKNNPTRPESGRRPKGEVIGTVYRVSEGDPNWSLGQKITTGENEVNPSRVEFLIGKKGSADKLIVAIEGPAKFSFIDSEHLHLFSGKMSAEVPKGFEGFRVTTNTAEVIDLGTRFAVTANEKGHAAVHVYEGKVTAGLARKDDAVAAGGVPKTLTANQTSRLNFRTRKFEPIRFDENVFTTTPIQSSLIEWNNSDLHVLDKRPVDFSKLKPNQVHIFRESSRVELTENLKVDILTAKKGRTLANGKRFKPGVIPAGTKISTYVISFITVRPQMQSPRIEVRFDSRILGIDGGKLNETAKPFAALDRLPPQHGHGIEHVGDAVEVKSDGRTLSASFRAGSGAGDSLRVIVLDN